MTVTSSTHSAPPSGQWQRRQRIRPKQYHSTPSLSEKSIQHDVAIGTITAKTLGPRGKYESGLVVNSTTRSSLKLLLAHAHYNLLLPPQPNNKAATQSAAIIGAGGSAPPAAAFIDNQRSVVVSKGDQSDTDVASPNSEAAAADSAAIAAPPASVLESVQSTALIPSPKCPPKQGIAIRHEYLLQMSKKSKRTGRGTSIGVGGGDIMDSLVSSIHEIETKQMRGVLSNGHRRDRSEDFNNVIVVSPAPVIQTSKSSTRSPNGTNKLSRRNRNPGRDTNGRLSLRSSNSHEQWLPPIEQEEDVFSIPSSRNSMNPPPSPRHPSIPIPTRSTSITRDLPAPQPFIPQRANSLMHTSAPPPIITTRPMARRAETTSDIPSYITRYLRERTESKENLSLDVPRSPRRSFNSSRSRNSTTIIPANDQYQRLKLVTKRQSSQGFERDLSATRHYYSLPPPNQIPLRRSASLKPSRSSMGSDGSNTLGRVNSNYVQEVLSNPKLTQRIRLTSGRILSFSEVGDENGWPVFCFTGMGLNRLVAAFYDEIATSFGLRIITPDRPGIGLSDEIRPSPKKVLAWADDITEICQALSIKDFSLLGHSLGATYALAVALRLPEKIRGRIHLLAPWIPLSQVNAATAMFDDISMDSSCMSFPATHRFLRVLPVPIIKVAGNFLREKEYDGKSNGMASPKEGRRSSSIPPSRNGRGINGVTNGDIRDDDLTDSPPLTPENDLVAGIWAAATRDSNATVDLLTSLERPHTVGFTYFDVTLPVVIRHGSKDERVPLERVIWMTKAMNMARQNNAELKVIQGAQHGLMARADVMSDVFEEIARDSHKWNGCIRCRKGGGCWLAASIKEGPMVPGKDQGTRL